MTTTAPLGRVSDLWRFPVKSMQGERLAEARIGPEGLAGDRAYALLDVEAGEVISASNRHFPGILDCATSFTEPHRGDGQAPPVRVTLPGGASAGSDSEAISSLLSSHFGREVALIRSVPGKYAGKQAAFFDRVGLPTAAPAGSFVDLCPLSIISTATLARLSGARPGSKFDPRRFRMNIVIETGASGFADNAWVGRQLALGAEVRVTINMPDPRCVMTTLPQGDLPKDPDILRSVTQLNSLPVGSGGPLPCAGVYATVETPGVVRVGDRVMLA